MTSRYLIITPCESLRMCELLRDEKAFTPEHLKSDVESLNILLMEKCPCLRIDQNKGRVPDGRL